uniref:Uncharacterized protein n=1 Tax=Oryza punctata TaxID=4537 RepID=A0A0E0JEZ2_ORYPU
MGVERDAASASGRALDHAAALFRCAFRAIAEALASLYEARTLASSSRATNNHLTSQTAAAAVEAEHKFSRSGDHSSAFSPPPFMEASTAQGPSVAPVPWQRLGQVQPRQRDGRWRARCALQLVVFAVVTAGFAAAACRARHRPRDIAFLAVTYWLIALLLCLVEKLEALRLDASRETELRRVRLAMWAVAVALGNMVAWRVSDAMPFLALKLGVWGVTLVILSFAYYFVFRSKAGECRDEEHGHAQADAGSSRPPEEKV